MTVVSLTGTGNWVVPDRVTSLFVEGTGADGSGGGTGAVIGWNGGGGGAGEYAAGTFSVTAGASIAYAVGVGGTASNNARGKDGTATTFGTLLTANGGKGGATQQSSNALGGAGGTGSTAPTHFDGGAGGAGLVNSNGGGGGAAATSAGAGAAGSGKTGATGAGNGGDATHPGGFAGTTGGGGGSYSSTAVAQSSGAGAAGLLTVTYTQPPAPPPATGGPVLDAGAVAVTTGAASTTKAFTIPSGAGKNHWVLIYCVAGSNAVTFSSPLFSVFPAALGTGGSGQLLYRIMDGTEGWTPGTSTVTVTSSSNTPWDGAICSVTGADALAPFDPAPTVSGQVNAASVTITVAGVTTTADADLLIWFGWADGTIAGGDAPPVITVPAGFTVPSGVTQASSTGTGSITNVGLTMATLTQGTHGATGNENGSVPVAKVNGGMLVALQKVKAVVQLEAGTSVVTTGGAAQTRSVVIPSGARTGDQILIYCAAGTPNNAWTAPGFTGITPVSDSVTASAQLLYHKMTGSEGWIAGTTAVTVTSTLLTPFEAAITAVNGEDPVNPFDPLPGASGQVNTSDTLLAVNGVTPIAAPDLALWFGFVTGTPGAGAAPPAITLPAGYTAVGSQVNSTATGAVTNSGLIVGQATLAAQGPTGQVNGSVAVAQVNGGMLVTLRAPAGTTAPVIDPGTATNPPQNGQVGAFFNAGNMGTADFNAAKTLWDSWAGTGRATKVTRKYKALSSFGYSTDSDLLEMITAGVKICLTLRPAYSPVSATDLANMETLLQKMHAAGAVADITLHHEPFYSGLTGPQYIAMVNYYGPTVRKYYPLVFCPSASAVDGTLTGGFYPGDGAIDKIAFDCYAYSYNTGTRFDSVAAIADSAVPPKPLAVWEMNGSTDPVNGQTQTVVSGYFSYVQSFFAARLAAGKTNGEILLFNSGNFNWLGSNNNQACGFEGGISPWQPSGGCTIAANATQHNSGTGSLAMTATGTTNMSARQNTTANYALGLPVTPGQIVSAFGFSKAATIARNCQATIEFYTSAGVLVSTASGTPAANVTTGWTQISNNNNTVPATAAYAFARMQTNTPAAAGEVHYWDDIAIFIDGPSPNQVNTVNFSWDYRIGLYQAMFDALNGAQQVSVTRAFIIPAGAGTGHLVRIYCAQAAAGTTWSAPGFTAVTAASGTGGSAQLLYRKIDGTEGWTPGISSVIVTCSVNAPWAGVISSVSGQDGNNPYDPLPTVSGQVNAASTTVAVAGVTTTAQPDLLVWYGFATGTTGAGDLPPAITPPAGFTAAAPQGNQTAAGATGVGVLMATATTKVIGATGAENGTLAASKVNGGLLAALKSGTASPSVSALAGALLDSSLYGGDDTAAVTGFDQTVGRVIGIRAVAYAEGIIPASASDDTPAGGGGGGGGTTANVITVTNPGSQSTPVGNTVSLQIHATDSDAAQPLTYTATGLPAGLSMTTAGLVTGKPTTAGSSTGKVTVSDPTGVSASTSFSWTVTPASTGGSVFIAAYTTTDASGGNPSTYDPVFGEWNQIMGRTLRARGVFAGSSFPTTTSFFYANDYKVPRQVLVDIEPATDGSQVAAVKAYLQNCKTNNMDLVFRIYHSAHSKFGTASAFKTAYAFYGPLVKQYGFKLCLSFTVYDVTQNGVGTTWVPPNIAFDAFGVEWYHYNYFATFATIRLDSSAALADSMGVPFGFTEIGANMMPAADPDGTPVCTETQGITFFQYSRDFIANRISAGKTWWNAYQWNQASGAGRNTPGYCVQNQFPSWIQWQQRLQDLCSKSTPGNPYVW